MIKKKNSRKTECFTKKNKIIQFFQIFIIILNEIIQRLNCIKKDAKQHICDGKSLKKIN